MATKTMADTKMSEVAINTSSTSERLPITVDKTTPYTYDLGHLSATDPNPLPPTNTLMTQTPTQLNTTLQTIARDGAQSLLTALLTTTTITSASEGVLMTLPSSAQPLPRWKPLPKPKAPTKWEQFAKKKGIGKFGGSLKGGAALEDRKKNMVFDEESGEWVKKWGYKGKKMQGEGEWLVELDDKQEKREKEEIGKGSGKTVRGEGRRERMERVRRQERKERNNARRSGKNG